MKYFRKLSLLYYVAVGVLSGSVILLFLHLIQWPVIAESALGITLFIHSLVLARTAKDLTISAYEKGLISELFNQLKNGYEISETHTESKR